MPHWFKDILVVTDEELSPFYSYYTLAQKLYRAEKRGYGMERAMRGGYGRQLLVKFDTLPNHIKAAIGDPRQYGHPLEQFYKTDKDAVDFYSNFTFSDGGYIKDTAQEKYITNASVLQATIQLKQAREQERLSKSGSLLGIMRTLSDDVNSFNKILLAKYNNEHTLPDNYRRFTDAFRKFTAEGYKSLIHGNHKNDNAAIATNETVALLNNIFSEPVHKPSIAEVSRQYESFLDGYLEVLKYDKKTGEVIGEYDPKEFKKLSESAIRNYLNSWDNRIATHSIRSGDRQVFMGKYKPYHSFERAKFSGSLLSIDDRNPPFECKEDGSRIWFYNGMDAASTAITCWVYGTSKDGIILEFYRQLVRNYHEWGLNLPAELECESNLNSSFKETFLKEGSMFQYVRIEANNARGKLIESQFNKTVRYSSDLEKGELGWISRPFAKSESNQAGSEPVPQLPRKSIIEIALRNIEKYNNKPHPDDKSISKWDYFLQNQNPDLKPTNYKSFLKYIGYHTKSTVNAGIALFQNQEFILGDDGEIYTGERLINLMKIVEGKELKIYWLDGNDGQIIKALAYIGSDYVCEMLPKPKPPKPIIERTDKDKELIGVMSSYVATVEGYRKEKIKTIEPVFVINNKPVTLNNNFKIKQLHSESVGSENTGEILPAIDEFEDLNSNEIRYKSPLKDRF